MMVSGNFFDKKIPRNWTHVNQGCGLWDATCIGGSNISLVYTIVIIIGFMHIIMPYLSSLKVDTLFIIITVLPIPWYKHHNILK